MKCNNLITTRHLSYFIKFDVVVDDYIIIRCGCMLTTTTTLVSQFCQSGRYKLYCDNNNCKLCARVSKSIVPNQYFYLHIYFQTFIPQPWRPLKLKEKCNDRIYNCTFIPWHLMKNIWRQRIRIKRKIHVLPVIATALVKSAAARSQYWKRFNVGLAAFGIII